jgi:hypothetical protein
MREATMNQQENGKQDKVIEVCMQIIQEEYAETMQDGAENRALDVNVLVLLVSRLAQVLGREVDMLESMNIKGLSTLQHEKLALVDALEKQKKLLARRPHLLQELDEEERDNLAELLHIFDMVVQENHNRLLVAKEVNQLVVDAIMDVAHENLRNGLYNDKGTHASERGMALSINRAI